MSALQQLRLIPRYSSGSFHATPSHEHHFRQPLRLRSLCAHSSSFRLSLNFGSIRSVMRLLHAGTKALQEFHGDDIPPYAILSHTWENDEVTFKDIEPSGYDSGSAKIDGCIRKAISSHLEYVWIDTCCIDKSSSAELSEAINSMWTWYKCAEVCYVYLSDVPDGRNLILGDSAFRKSRWFTRGWTLQELIAPGKVLFYDASWRFLGTKYGGEDVVSLHQILYQITRIPSGVLSGRSRTREWTVAQKMSWAANRTTTRTEDIAYCLLGLFGVNMSLIYGEGKRAFIRLQEEIINENDDQSIFAGGFLQTPEEDELGRNSLLASSPADFANCGHVEISHVAEKSSHFSMTNKGLHIEMSICELGLYGLGGTSIGRLNCSFGGLGRAACIALPLISIEGSTSFFRAKGCAPIAMSWDAFPTLTGTGPNVYIKKTYPRVVEFDCGFRIKCWLNDQPFQFEVPEIYPPTWRGILHEYRSSIWHRDIWEIGDMHKEIIMFLCQGPMNGPSFVVLIEYTFIPDDEATYTILRPQSLVGHAAIIDKGKTLAEILLAIRGNPETNVLDWKCRLDTLNIGGFKVGFLLDQPENPDGTVILNLLVEDLEHVRKLEREQLIHTRIESTMSPNCDRTG
jgi:hypothetical protein